MAAVTIATSSTQKNYVRPPIVSYTKSKWDEYFTSFSLDHQVQEKYGKAIEALKEEVKSMLVTMANNYSSGNTKTRGLLVLIDTLERLGVAYHFDQEIEELLGQVFKSHGEDEEDTCDLFITSLQFRLLRQHRYHASCGVFNKFISKNNKFKENLSDDVVGLLSLYEAAHLRVHGEPILDEAVAFSVHHLKRTVQHLESTSPLEDHVKRALEMPLHRNSPRLHTHHFISLYEKDDSKNELLLKLAKLDFNYVQNIYKKDLCELSRWSNELKLHSEFQHVRIRVAESYHWGTLFHFEPGHSCVRMAVAKTVQMLTIIDDTCDNYATVEEVDLFTDIIQRWNIAEIDQLPDHIKSVYKLILSEYDDYEREASEQGKLFAVPYARENVKQLCKAYSKGMKWITGQEIPSFEEYIENSITTSGIILICTRMIPGFKSVNKETIDWLRTKPKIAVASAIVGRYLNDVSGFQRESKQGIYMTGLDFYMKQHGVSMQEAADKFIELTEDVWKDLNTEWLVRNPQVPKEMVEHVLGYARSIEFLYRSSEDKFTKSEAAEPYIVALFVDQIII